MFFVFFLILLVDTSIAYDDILSTSGYFDAHPHVQIKGENVNITYIPVNNTDINSVQLAVIYPDKNLKIKNI